MRRGWILLAAMVATCSAAAVSAPSVAADPVTPTPGAVNVRDFGATGDGSADDTAAFRAAMNAAQQAGAVRFAGGPTGDAQGVVYVPPGTYRLLNLTFPSNLRMEVDAGAVLEQAGGRNATSPPGYTSPAPTLVLWDGPAGAPLRNVSLVGVGSSTGGRKTVASPVAEGWSIDNSFTFDLDPAVTNASNLVSAVLALNVDGFAVSHAFSIQNDSQPTTTPSSNADWWPSSRKAALVLRARADTPIDGSAYYDPHHGTVSDWYNVNAPRGFGPNQVTSGHDLTFRNVFSQGGTALRLETDNSDGTKFGSEVRAVTATNIAALRCNRAVAFAPHEQDNAAVTVAGVRATACYQGVVESVDEGVPIDRRGVFADATIRDVSVVGGDGAQIPIPNSNGEWTSGTAFQAFARESTDTWAVVYAAGTYACSGAFATANDRIVTTDGELRPVCASGSDGGGDATPVAPSDLRATALSASKIKLTWTGVPGATGYRVSRALASSGPFVAVADTPNRRYRDTRLKRNTTYYYVVQTLVGTAASDPSAAVSATTLAS